MPTNKPRVMVTFDEDEKQAIEAWASHEETSESKLVKKIVRAVLIETGWLEETNILKSKKPRKKTSDRKT